MSWFYLEGRTDQLPIDHAGIQKTLVQIGDKQPNFMGSKEVTLICALGLIYKNHLVIFKIIFVISEY